MALFEAYFDESGTHDESPVISVGGALARQTSWMSIATQWKAVLDKFGAKSFHAKELYHSRGQYEGWNKDKRERFINKLFGILEAEYNFTLVGFAVLRSEFDEAMKNFEGTNLTPYQFCCERCVSEVNRIAVSRKSMPPVTIAFEAGQKINSPIMKLTRGALKLSVLQEKYKIRRISVLEKTGVTPFEVADFIVYETYKYHSGFDSRYPMFRFSKNFRSEGRIFDSNIISKWIKLTLAYEEYKKNT